MLSSVPMGVMLSGGSPIDLDASFFVQMAIFFVAFFILRSLVFKPVMELFDARDAAMDGARSDADRMEQDADGKREHFEGELRKVRDEANRDRERLRNEAQKLARELTEDARKESTAALSSAKAKLDLEAKGVHDKVVLEIPALAGKITEKLLNRSVN